MYRRQNIFWVCGTVFEPHRQPFFLRLCLLFLVILTMLDLFQTFIGLFRLLDHGNGPLWLTPLLRLLHIGVKPRIIQWLYLLITVWVPNPLWLVYYLLSCWIRATSVSDLAGYILLFDVTAGRHNWQIWNLWKCSKLFCWLQNHMHWAIETRKSWRQASHALDEWSGND